MRVLLVDDEKDTLNAMASFLHYPDVENPAQWTDKRGRQVGTLPTASFRCDDPWTFTCPHRMAWS